MADSTDRVNRPADWDKAVSAAYLRLLGASLRAAASGAGVGERTMERWVHCDWWPKAMEEAADRWMNDLTAAARKTLLKAVQDGRSDQALTILERIDPRLMPPKQRHEHSGPGGAPIPTEVTVTRRVITADDGDA